MEPYPDGLDVEIFKSSAITKINKMNLKNINVNILVNTLRKIIIKLAGKLFER